MERTPHIKENLSGFFRFPFKKMPLPPGRPGPSLLWKLVALPCRAGHLKLGCQGKPRLESLDYGIPGQAKVCSLAKRVARRSWRESCWSVNHGAGRAMGRKEAGRRLDQKTVDAEMDANDILSNCRRYPIDESPDACKNFAEVLKSVEHAGPAQPVATLNARFVIKDNDKADD